jgi:hypothetical protein
MTDLILRRVAIPEDATFGVLIRVDTAVPFAVTLEREADGWSNRKSTPTRAGACIPAGTYTCQRVQSPKFGNTFEVTGVPGRSHILFHKGNLADDSRGCILVGEAFNPVGGVDGITASKEGFTEFLAINADAMSFTLTVLNP